MSTPTSVAVAFCACWFAVSPAVAQPQGPPPGPWVAVFHSYPHLIRVDLTMPPLAAGGKAEVDIRVDGLVAVNSVLRAPAGVAKAIVEYDPAARMLTVTPAANAYATLGRLPTLAGVFDAERQVVGGVLVPINPSASPYFVLAPRDIADGAFLRTLGDAISRQENRQPPPPQRRGLLGAVAGAIAAPDVPSQERMREWVGRLQAEYPDVDPYRTEMSRLFSMARNLFRDQYFEPFFGKPFDQLSTAELRAITMELRKITPPRANFPEERPNGTLVAIRGAFNPSGTYSAPDLALGVLATRFIDGWRTQSLRAAESAGASSNALAAITALERAEQQVLALHWPSERAAFATTLSASRGRLASPALASRIDELLAGARSFAAVPQLMQALRPAPVPPPSRAGRMPVGAGRAPSQPAPSADTLAGLLALATEEERRTQLARVEARLSELVTAEGERDRAALATLGSGLDGLQAGQRWHAEVASKYGVISERPEVPGLMAAHAERRQVMLRESESALTSRITQAASTAELNQLRGTYLGVPSDTSDPIGGRLISMMQQRAAGLQQTEQAAAAKQAEAERQARSVCAKMSADNGADGVPGEPTERDMCQAIERALVGSQENLASLQAECRGLNAQSNPLSGLMCLTGSLGQIGGGPQLSVNGFEKIACVSAAAAGRPGFFCDYIVWLHSANAMMGPLNRFSGEVTTSRFVRTRGQWIFLPPK